MKKTPFSDIGRYVTPLVVTPPAAEILAAIRRGETYANLAAIHGVSESTLRRRGEVSGLVARRRGQRAPLAPHLTDGEYPAWMDDGLCAQTDPALFFPESGESPRLARSICAECPVRDLCLAWALDHDERFGIFGGTTPAERKKIRKEQRP
jgi:WhiB family redox-sensing transcriptional regulator